jgi:hypothetical protein
VRSLRIVQTDDTYRSNQGISKIGRKSCPADHYLLKREVGLSGDFEPIDFKNLRATDARASAETTLFF